jgi:hypothetical protein
MIAPEERPASIDCRIGRLRYGLMSLSEMVNCQVAPLCSLCSQLMLYQLVYSDSFTSNEDIDAPVEDATKEQIAGWMKIATYVANEFEWKSVHDRIAIIRRKLKKPLSGRDLGVEMRVLLETVKSGLEWQLIYRYPQEANDILTNWTRDWETAIKSFPLAKSEIVAGVDLWSLGHWTASVFQFMRVLEYGLRALATDVGKNFDIQNWQNIIEEIEAEIRSLGKSLSRGAEKNERLQFLSEAAKEFVYFKDGWRNYVSHGRGVYDKHQARSVMEHVRTFMSTLSSRLNG